LGPEVQIWECGLKLRVELVTSFSPDGKRRHNKVATDVLNSIELDFFKIEIHRSS
jgi:hypothetical protein